MSVPIIFCMSQVADWINANDGMHWGKKARLRKAWREAGLTYARRHKLPRLDRARIDIHVHKRTNHPYDPANLQDTAKPIVDGMVTDYGLLEDDNHHYLEGPFMHAGEKQSKPGLTITITPLAPDAPQEADG